MKYEFVTTGQVKNGVVKMRNRAQLDAYMKRWPDCEITIRFEKAHATRSLAANAYYFGVCLELLSEHTGYTVEELHEWAKAKFLPKELAICNGNGEVVDDLVIGGTTTSLNKNEFYEYVERVRTFAFDRLDLDIPPPDPQWRDKAEAA
jgi:hypothetical protein